MQHAIPAAREAQRVIAMTPLFWENVVLGGDVIRTARMLFKPSAKRPHLHDSSKRKGLTYLHHSPWPGTPLLPGLLEYDYQHPDLPRVSRSHRRWLGYHPLFPQRSLRSPKPMVRRQEDRNLPRRVVDGLMG